MNCPDLRGFIRLLEQSGKLKRITAEVDPDQEITIIQHRVLAGNGPALFFERVKGSSYPIVSNLFGTPDRVTAAFGRPPAEIGQQLAGLIETLMPPTLSGLLSKRDTVWNILHTGLKTVGNGPIMENVHEPPDLMQLPCLKCWPLDGGYFFTLPLVHTVDPVTGRANLGIYRMQRYGAASTGMHWQIEKGGGFHFSRAKEKGQPLRVSVFLGGPPVLTLAAIAPLPEGIDERLLASFIMDSPLAVILRPGGHRIPADAEFVLEGTVSPGDEQREGPFGDHLGHYSHSADFPVLRVERILARTNAIYPATVVGKPPQEDYYIGEALQEMTLPLLRVIKPGISDLWAYPETGFHPLAVASVRQRYEREALKHAFSILGEGQLSLTKVLIMVDTDVNVRDFSDVSRAIWRHLDPSDGLHLIAPSAQDTLDFTGTSLNTGSRLILLANVRHGKPPRKIPPAAPPDAASVHPGIIALANLGEGVLVAQVRDGADTAAVRDALHRHPVTREYILHVLVSADVPMNDPRLMLWGWFTRFDPCADLHPFSRETRGNRVILHPPITFDATWKTGYRKPVGFDPDKEALVNRRWHEYGLP